MAALGNHVDVVSLLLEHRPNVNALDKDGCTALAIACREGYHEVANALLNAGAYVNIQDRTGTTNLIHAVKGGHRAVVESLLKKYADVSLAGKVRPSPLPLLAYLPRRSTKEQTSSLSANFETYRAVGQVVTRRLGQNSTSRRCRSLFLSWTDTGGIRYPRERTASS